MDLQFPSITEASAAIKTKKVSPVEITQRCLDQAELVQQKINPFVVLLGEQALATARQAETEIMKGDYRGELHGIPLVIKDLCDMEGLPTTASSEVRFDHVAKDNAACVDKLINAGAIIIGKTHTHEFAYGIITPKTRNPWDENRIPGGSSGGTAAAVASGACLGGIGTDTGGSIRIPASLCGTVGLKPTFGRVSRYGVTSLSWSLDHVGPLTRSVEDAAIMLGALAGFDPRDPGCVNLPVPNYMPTDNNILKGLRVGVPANYYFDAIDPEVEAIVREAYLTLERQGASLETVNLPLAEHYMGVEFGLCLPEASAYHQEMLRERADKYEDDVRTFLEAGELVPATDYIKALRVREVIKQSWQKLYERIDVLAAPTTPSTAAKVGQEAFTWPDGNEESVTSAYVRLSCPANLTGLPSISVPCGFSTENLPVGMQILGRPFEEQMIVDVANAYEFVTDWRSQSPDI
ncbi:MAG: amidase [Alphaproteobacteria bacterium]